MSFIASIKYTLRQYASATGRASRSELWYWILFTLLGSVLMGVLDVMLFSPNKTLRAISPLQVAFNLVIFLPTVAVGIRRLHDTNRSWVYWLGSILLIPLIIWFCQKGTEGPNRFGEEPIRF